MHAEIHAGTVTSEQSDGLLAVFTACMPCLHFVRKEENFFVLAPAAQQ